MHLRRTGPGFVFGLMIPLGCFLALSGCSQEENLEADPGASPFYPGPADPKGASTRADKGPAKASVAPDDLSKQSGAAGPNPADASAIDARFGTNEVERQLRVALRTAEKGELAAAAVMLDKILAVEPVHREALRGRAFIAMDQSQRAKSVDDRLAAIEQAIGFAQTLGRAYDNLKPQEKEILSVALYGKAKALNEKGQTDQAVAALKAISDAGFNGFSKVDLDDSMAKLRATPQFKAAHQADDAQRLIQAREKVKGRLAPPLETGFTFTLDDLDGKKVSLADFKGQVVLVDYWGTWCGPCRQAIPFLIGLYRRQHPHGLEIVGLTYERDATSESQAIDMIKKFIKEASLPYRCLLGDEKTVRQIPGWKGFPTSVLVDRAGKVRLLITENDTETPELIDNAVRVLLAEPAPKPEPAPSKKK